MKLEKLSRLITALTTPAQTSQSKPTEQEKIDPGVTASYEAVKLSEGFGSQGSSDAAGKVARLKEQVQNGTYKVSSEDVARSLLSELFA